MQNSITLDDNTRKQIHSLSIAIAERLAADLIPDPLHPKNLVEKELQLKLDVQINAFFEQYAQGIKELMAAVIILRKSNPDIDLGEIFTEFDRLGKGLNQIGSQPDDARSLREICNIANPTMEVFDSAVSDLYEHQEYEKALKAYAFLTFIEPNQPAYWVGYGNCEFFGRHYDKAMDAYQTAVSLNSKDPKSLFYLAHCYHELQQKDLAVNTVNAAVEVIKAQPELHDWLEKAEQLKQHFNVMAVK